MKTGLAIAIALTLIVGIGAPIAAQHCLLSVATDNAGPFCHAVVKLRFH